MVDKISRLFATAAVAMVVLAPLKGRTQDSQALRLGIGVNAGIGTKDPFGFVLGGDLKLQKDFMGPVSGTLSTGFTHFFLKDKFKDINDPYNVIPVKAGLKAFANSNFYVAAELGAGFSTDKGVKTSFVWSPSIGWAFSNGVDVGIKYEDFTKYSSTKQVALRLAYGFNLGK